MQKQSRESNPVGKTFLTLWAAGSHQNLGRCLHTAFPSKADTTSVCQGALYSKGSTLYSPYCFNYKGQVNLIHSSNAWMVTLNNETLWTTQKNTKTKRKPLNSAQNVQLSLLPFKIEIQHQLALFFVTSCTVIKIFAWLNLRRLSQVLQMGVPGDGFQFGTEKSNILNTLALLCYVTVM